MRREWSGWIKNRQWPEFERLAKTDPSDGLADTVAELERGFPDKADRRALRKILFLLAQAGYRPRPIEEYEPANVVATASREWGFLTSADATGDSIVTYACESGDKVRVLMAHVNGELGVTRASEDEHFRDAGLSRMEAFRQLDPKPYVHAEIPAAFAKWRIAEGMKHCRGHIPPTLAYWRGTLDKAEPTAHPAEALPRGASDEELYQIPLTNSAAVAWRLELGNAAPLIERMYELQNQPDASDDALKPQVDAARAEAAKEVFTPGLISDHVSRLLDLGYLLHLRGRPGADTVLAAADDLKVRGSDSPYARALLDKTMVILVESLRRVEKSPAEA